MLLSTNPHGAVLDIDQMLASPMRSAPYAWALLSEVIRSEWLQSLVHSFPDSGFDWASGADEKPYLLRVRHLVRPGATDVIGEADLSPAWLKLCAELSSPRYRETVSALTGCDLSACSLEINLWVYENECFLSPHTDKEDKVVSHIIYLSPAWDPTWGGQLKVLRSNDSHDCSFVVSPTHGTSVIIVRSDESWHAVEPIAKSASVKRQSIQVTFWR